MGYAGAVKPNRLHIKDTIGQAVGQELYLTTATVGPAGLSQRWKGGVAVATPLFRVIELLLVAGAAQAYSAPEKLAAADALAA